MAKRGRSPLKSYDSRGRDILLAFAAALLPAPVAAAPAQAPDFTIHLLSGGEVQSSSLKGKVIVLNFWASWCAPCKGELAELDAAFLRYGPNRVAVFAIDAESTADPRRLARQAATMRIPVATAISDPYYRPRNNAVPTTFIIDQAGHLVLTKAGAFKPGEIAVLIATLLGVTATATANSATGSGR